MIYEVLNVKGRGYQSLGLVNGRKEMDDIILSHKGEYKYILIDQCANRLVYLMHDKEIFDCDDVFPYPKTKKEIKEICRIVRARFNKRHHIK